MNYQNDKPLYQAPDSAEGFKFVSWIGGIVCIFAASIFLLLVGLFA